MVARVEGQVTNDTLHALRAYLRPPERARRPGRLTPFRSRRLVPPSAEGRWTRDRGAKRRARDDPVGHGVCAATAHASRRRHARSHGDRADPRRLQHDLHGAAPARGNRPGPARLLRRRTRRGAVRATGRSRSAARGARGSRDTACGHARGNRSGQSVRRAAAVARVVGRDASRRA